MKQVEKLTPKDWRLVRDDRITVCHEISWRLASCFSYLRDHYAEGITTQSFEIRARQNEQNNINKAVWITNEDLKNIDLIVVTNIESESLSALGTMISLVPAVGEWYDIFTLLEWKDPFTNIELTRFEKVVTWMWLLSGVWSGKWAKDLFNAAFQKIWDELWLTLKEMLWVADEFALAEYGGMSKLGDPIRYYKEGKFDKQYIIGKIRERAEGVIKKMTPSVDVLSKKISCLLSLNSLKIENIKNEYCL